MKVRSNISYPMHLKTGDTVKIITGKDKGKIGKIIKIISKKSHIIVEGINIKSKHQKSSQEGENGSIIKREVSFHSSNAMLYSETTETASRVKYKISDTGDKSRCLIKNEEVIN